MSAKLPHVSGAEAVKAFERLGWSVARTSGSHVMMTKPGAIATLSVPQHDELAPGTLRKLIKAAELTVQQFVDAL